ncbi:MULTISPECIES: energy-coupling factor transporter ATPase [Bacillaceae]|uniref:energy-coupling factor transporter ATPase n=1 Tax=Bacillaceae TaxID=186817 RepID=UPI001F43072E|nr:MULTISPECIES: energy-coupling factor transporter ATPase [Bacillaceae]
MQETLQGTIHVDSLTFQFQGNGENVLTDISLSLRAGEWVSIVGHNGSGKSTLAKFLNGLLIPVTGDVTILGMNTKDFNNQPLIRKKVSMVFQNPDNQLVAPTVADDVAFGLENAGVPFKEMQARVRNTIHTLGLSGLENSEPSRLSGGQKQRVALAGALVLQPEILILDEATSMLDPIGKKEVMDQVQRLRRETELTIVMITHDLNEALMSDRVIVLKEGRIVGDGPPLEVLSHSEMLADTNLIHPFIIEIMEGLKGKGYDLREVNNTIITEQELVDAIWKLKQMM